MAIRYGGILEKVKRRICKNLFTKTLQKSNRIAAKKFANLRNLLYNESLLQRNDDFPKGA
ncbi:hypothetical protein DWW99_13210 [[Clostridium] leptum]|nr:hypothetical protein DWW99_13210 [[Clostridium] leptum]